MPAGIRPLRRGSAPSCAQWLTGWRPVILLSRVGHEPGDLPAALEGGRGWCCGCQFQAGHRRDHAGPRSRRRAQGVPASWRPPRRGARCLVQGRAAPHVGRCRRERRGQEHPGKSHRRPRDVRPPGGCWWVGNRWCCRAVSPRRSRWSSSNRANRWTRSAPSVAASPNRCTAMSGSERDRRVAALLARVGINPAHADAAPDAFSGGQLQRIVLARALAAEPQRARCATSPPPRSMLACRPRS